MDKFFSNMPLWINEKCEKKVYKSGETLIKKSDVITHVFFIQSGKIKVVNEFENGAIYAFLELPMGNFIGDIEILADKEIAAATNTAVGECEVIKIPKECFMKWIEEDPHLALAISRIYASRMWSQSIDKGKHIVLSGMMKVVNSILKIEKKVFLENKVIRINKTRQQIADEVGVSVKTVNRAIIKLKEDGLIQVQRGKIILDKSGYKKMENMIKK